MSELSTGEFIKEIMYWFRDLVTIRKWDQMTISVQIKNLESRLSQLVKTSQSEAQARIAELEAENARNTWQPIETAPKNGEYLLLAEGSFVTLGTWMNSDALREEAWIAFDSIRTIHKTTVMSPDFWMPLPKMPIEVAKDVKPDAD